MAYADYTFYVETYLGNKIPSDSFDRAIQEASAFIDLVTFGRAATEADAALITRIQHASCAVAEEVFEQTQTNWMIQSERVGQHAVTYNVSKQGDYNWRKLRAAKNYLGDTALMYSGF